MQFIDEMVCCFKFVNKRGVEIGPYQIQFLFIYSHSAPHEPKRAYGSQWSGPLAKMIYSLILNQHYRQNLQK